MPTLLILFGLRFYFYTRDHEPIHIHVKSSDGEAKFEIEEDLRLVYNNGLKPKDVKLPKVFSKRTRRILLRNGKGFSGNNP
jgi:hypothetical protein